MNFQNSKYNEICSSEKLLKSKEEKQRWSTAETELDKANRDLGLMVVIWFKG
jgi:hypothetical protein